MGSVKQVILQAIEQGRPGFVGGWVSSFAFDYLLEERRIRVSRNKRRAVLEDLGYIYHPKLSAGRATTELSEYGVTGRPRLFVKPGHLSINLLHTAEVVRAYQDAQAKAAEKMARIAMGEDEPTRGGAQGRP